MEKMIKRMMTVILLAMISSVAAAEVKVTLNEAYTGGAIAVAGQSEPAEEDDSVVVTITVTPEKGYYISKGDVEVLLVRDPTADPPSDQASATRADGEEDVKTLPMGSALKLTLVDQKGNPMVDDKGNPVSDPADLTQARNYQFTVPKGLGAWVSKAGFRKIDLKGEIGDVTWAISSEASKSSPDKVTLTLDGKGSVSIKEGELAPWVMLQTKITHVVVGADIEGLDKGLLDGCTALTSVAIQKDDAIMNLGENAIPANEGLEVDVPGNLYNEYQTIDAWKAFAITSTKGIEMKDVAFTEKNHYDTFVSSEKAVKVPSVLNAFVITEIKENTVVIDEILDGIIPADVPVLLFSKELESEDLRTAATENSKDSYTTILKVAGEEGQEVKLGEVYLLYNDVFYLSQQGIIPEGGIYLPIPEQADPAVKTRSALTIGGGDATGIDDLRSDEAVAPFCYSLDGRRLNGVPSRKGIYIVGGKKVIIR